MIIIVIDSNKYKIQNEKISLREKFIEFNLEDANSEFYRYLEKYFWSQKYMINHIELSYAEKVSIYNCYFALNKNIVTLRFNTAIIGMYSEDFDRESTSCIYGVINYLEYNMTDIEEFITNNHRFTNGRYNYSIKVNFSPRYGIIKLEYKNNISVKSITKEFIEFFEFICFICGCYFELREIYYNIKNKKIKRILNLNSKFDLKKKNLNTNKVIIDYIKLDIKKSYNEWKKIRKLTHLILDLYESLMSNYQFYEVSLAILLNCMEGYIKSIHKKDVVKLEKIKLDRILENTYFSTKSSKIVMKNAERKRYDIYTRLGTHRNYFDHLDRIQKSFKGEMCEYILLKCDLLFRLYILNDLNIPIDIGRLRDNVKNIEKRYQK